MARRLVKHARVGMPRDGVFEPGQRIDGGPRVRVVAQQERPRQCLLDERRRQVVHHEVQLIGLATLRVGVVQVQASALPGELLGHADGVGRALVPRPLRSLTGRSDNDELRLVPLGQGLEVGERVDVCFTKDRDGDVEDRRGRAHRGYGVASSEIAGEESARADDGPEHQQLTHRCQAESRDRSDKGGPTHHSVWGGSSRMPARCAVAA